MIHFNRPRFKITDDLYLNEIEVDDADTSTCTLIFSDDTRISTAYNNAIVAGLLSGEYDDNKHEHSLIVTDYLRCLYDGEARYDVVTKDSRHMLVASFSSMRYAKQFVQSVTVRRTNVMIKDRLRV